ncbi:helix-turn-helix domain-containing protein [Mesorhizobium sp. M1A.F.Ca.ET.072.01.1.1]|uniref:helix-turn-helix transcriptional regulator n=1 Tax=Mesorhizobium sp. M1A.F.Ca.ET.072.01.1.1 TaxID=2496753 RepID=UPI000FD312A6|nr:helix-turn-helix transcriptional regulator [Mesorhizobium sp. M1A.F.Ca.ET.072.01.1.1]RUW53701.1 helix-turn-helix domain-containing protein [Mesorhizobium sp. M1A.F.Ca.ET.072.01.1.1]TIU95924.1 MAG: helix-turn-helix domain-containing protein [Mesorhizobium sp.]
MKKYTAKGATIKQLRDGLERLSTQKEMAAEIGVSERKLRMIENNNAAIPMTTVDRLAKALGVRREQIIYSEGGPAGVEALEPPIPPVPPVNSASEERPQIIPRFDWDYAYATSDETRLYHEASHSHDLVTTIEIAFTEETSAYAEELFEILGGLTYAKRDILKNIEPAEEIALRRRIRQLLVLLKGNDVWVYETSFFRRLPERMTLPPDGEEHTLQSRLLVALAPPGEYGERSLRVNIDHGQPFVLLSLKSLKAKSGRGEDAGA